MATLQLRHQRGCWSGKQVSNRETAEQEGCDCKPTAYIVSRVDGRLVREYAGTDPATWDDRLASVNVHTREGDYKPPSAMRVNTYADEFLDALGHRRSTTERGYRETLAYARRAFGRKYLSKLTPADVRAFLSLIECEYDERYAKLNRRREKAGQEPRRISPTTLAKHLRHLSTFLEAARLEGHLSENPVEKLPPSTRPKPRKRRPAYFTDSELVRLWPELKLRPAYLTACKLAVTTGMRHGEIAGLTWNDVDLLTGEINVRQQWTHGELVDRTKDDEPRVVDLVPAARALLEEWYRETGDDGLVVEMETGGYLDDSNTRKVLYVAMEQAGIPRVGERGGERTFHSFRHTFARVALEHGAQLEWVQAQLGHSTITLTRDLYGHWSREAEKREAERLEGAFAV